MKQTCAVVFGPGRSGTSLTMKLLDQAGLRLSAELEPASEDNPDGHFEDVAISRSIHELVRSLNWSPYQFRPDAWRDTETSTSTRTTLQGIVAAEVAAGSDLWGFKNPRICLTWPLWRDVFTAIEVEPALVFCSRNATAVVRSLMRAYEMPQQRAEALYFFRCVHALEDVSEQIFFVPYAEWGNDGAGLLAGLADHCGLATSNLDVEKIVQENFTESLNRQSTGADIELSGVVRDLDALLADCVGTDYDVDVIADFCASARRRFDDFKFIGDALERERTETGASVLTMARRSVGRARRVTKRLRTR